MIIKSSKAADALSIIHSKGRGEQFVYDVCKNKANQLDIVDFFEEITNTNEKNSIGILFKLVYDHKIDEKKFRFLLDCIESINKAKKQDKEEYATTY